MSPTTPTTRPRRAANRRPRLPRPPRPSSATIAVRFPPAAETPDWSPETTALLDVLTVLERGVVEWRATGVSAAEAYRRATGRDSAAARQSAYQILARPHFAAALSAALNDRNVGARCDREWKMSKLYSTVNEAQGMHSAAGMRVLVGAIGLLARLQGDFGPGRAARPTEAQTAHRVDVARRIDEIIADAGRPTNAPKAPPPEPNSPDQLVAEEEVPAALQRPRPAVVGPQAATQTPEEAPPTVEPAIPAAEKTWRYGPVKPAAAPPPPEDGLPIGMLRAGPLNIVRRPAVPEPIPDEPAPTRWLVPANWDVWSHVVVETRLPRPY
jgi:hypothetical protein